MLVRRAREDDGDAACALWHDADAAHADLAPAYFRAGRRAAREWREVLAENNAAVFVGEDEATGGLLGLGIVRVHGTPPDTVMVPALRAHVELVVVARGARRRGLGRHLMKEIADWSRRQGASDLVLTVWAGNQEAEAFYERLGFVPLTRSLHAPL